MLVPKNLLFSLKNSTPITGILFNILTRFASAQASRNFGIMQEYNDRKNKKLTNNILTTDRPMYWVTSSRPSNFGDPLDAKTKVDNWFDENR